MSLIPALTTPRIQTLLSSCDTKCRRRKARHHAFHCKEFTNCCLTHPCSHELILTATLPHVQEQAQPKPAPPPRGGLGLGFFPYASARPMMGGLGSYPAGLADRASAFGRHDSFSYQPVSTWLLTPHRPELALSSTAQAARMGRM